MYVKVSVNGKPIQVWDMGQYGQGPEAREALQDLCDKLNQKYGSLKNARFFEVTDQLVFPIPEDVGEYQ